MSLFGYKLARCTSKLKNCEFRVSEIVQFQPGYSETVNVLTNTNNDTKKGVYSETGVSIPKSWFDNHFEVLED